MTAARQEIGVSVVFSHSTDHYLRVYATVKHGAKEADESIKDMGYVLHCFGCLHRETVRGRFAISHSGRCPECSSKLSSAGPLWLGKILNEEFCESMEEEARKSQYRLGGKVRKILALLKSEVDSPMSYYVVDKLCDMLNLPMPPVRKVVEALRKEEGCQVSLTHFSATGIKSDASSTKIREILLELTGNDR
jgi:tRNA (guanine26-N2/guanine27-N2)-dimethyltransferase